MLPQKNKNKNALVYAEIVVTDTNSRILDIEGHSKDYIQKSEYRKSKTKFYKATVKISAIT